ncbi:hypothetical protein [Lysobacter sp. TAB13]|uniref:hypothetical protein n=1 Tax=Lysobacter sp. TAB13 TaxID=3233065 RepID=UPI003F9D38DC
MPSIDNTIYDHVHATGWDHDGFMALLRTSVNKLGRMSFADLGSKLKLKRSEHLSISHMGFARAQAR